MGRHDTSKAGELRVLAERLRRRAREMTMAHYIDMMERAAGELDAEAREIEESARSSRPGQRLNIVI